MSDPRAVKPENIALAKFFAFAEAKPVRATGNIVAAALREKLERRTSSKSPKSL